MEVIEVVECVNEELLGLWKVSKFEKATDAQSGIVRERYTVTRQGLTSIVEFVTAPNGVKDVTMFQLGSTQNTVDFPLPIPAELDVDGVRFTTLNPSAENPTFDTVIDHKVYGFWDYMAGNKEEGYQFMQIIQYPGTDILDFFRGWLVEVIVY